jgi:AcrR family transcriptional regulator
MRPIAGTRGGSTAPLYRKLRPRPNGPPREEIVANQRTRLCGAIIEASAVHGYANTSVAELCRLAGVSKRTFYEQFDNKQACFLVSYDRVQSCASARMASARESEPDWEQGLRAGLEALVHGLLQQSHAARLALVEVDAAGQAALAARQDVRSAFERTIVASFDRAPHGVPLPPPLAKGIVCGIERTMRRTVLAGAGESTREHAPARARTGAGTAPEALARELAAWALSYSSPALAELPVTAPQRDALLERPWSPVRARISSERVRILRAAAEIVAGEGHARLERASSLAAPGSTRTRFGRPSKASSSASWMPSTLSASKRSSVSARPIVLPVTDRPACAVRSPS